MIEQHFSLSLQHSRYGMPALSALVFAASTLGLVACGSDDEPNVQQNTEELDEAPRRIFDPETMRPSQEEPPREQDSQPSGTPGGPTPNGLALPADFRDWRVIGIADPPPDNNGNDTIRVIVGNDTAVAAARAGATNPWPDGSMIAHYVWSAAEHATAASTIAPGDFGALTLMVKNAERYADDGGWAYGLWATEQLVPADAGFDRACVNCHTAQVADNDYVFTRPGDFPRPLTVARAVRTLNDLPLPADILDWRVIGVANRGDNGTLRVIVGNDVAVDAARAGEVESWPEGSMLAHYSWQQGENEDAPGVVAPGAFDAITLMVKRSREYVDDGGWAYGLWTSEELTPAPSPNFDRSCVDCHTARVADRDYVFTVPGPLPPQAEQAVER